MITRYERPESVEDAIKLLENHTNNPVVLAGGTYPDELSGENLTAIDLQALDFNRVIQDEVGIKIEGLVTLQKLADKLPSLVAIEKAVMIEGGRNVRNSRTLHQHLFFCNGRSALAAVLLSLAPTLEFLPKNHPMSLISFFEHRTQLQGCFVKEVVIEGHPAIAFESIARSPLDLPLLIICLAFWPDGRMRITIGGFGEVPQVAYDGKDGDELLLSLENITFNAGDQWASAQYRQETADILARRCMQQLGLHGGEV